MKVYVNCDSHSPALSKADYLVRADQRLGLGVFDYLPNNLIDPEYVLNIEPYSFKRGTKWTGIWEIDLLLDRASMGGAWTEADDVFIADYTLPNRLEHFRDKAILLFQAIDPELHKRIPEIKQEYDFIHCGLMTAGVYQPRIDAVNLLREKFSFQGFDNGLPTNEYVRVLNTAKVQFIRSMSTPIGDGEIAQRFFECLAIGPVLTNHVEDLKYTGLVEGEDYLSYRNDKEMLEKMQRLIDDPDYREKIAASGRKKALLMHTFEHRLVSILKIIHEHS